MMCQVSFGAKVSLFFFFHIFYLLTNIFYYLLVFQGPVLKTKKNWQLDWTKTNQDQTAVSVFLIFLK